MSFYGKLVSESSLPDEVVMEGMKEWWAKLKEDIKKNKEYNKKYQEWLKKAKDEGKEFFPALSKAEVDEFYKIDSNDYFKDGRHSAQLIQMYEHVQENVKTKNYIEEQMDIMRYWLKVYKPLYDIALKKEEER